MELIYQMPVKVKPPPVQRGVNSVSQPKDFYVGMNYANSAANWLANYMLLEYKIGLVLMMLRLSFS